MNNNAIAVQQDNAETTVKEMVRSNWQAIAASLPETMPPKRFAQLVFNSVRKTPKLAQCSATSLIGSLLAASTLGLEVDTPLGEAYLVPYGSDAQLIVGYQGLVKLYRQHPSASVVGSGWVGANDTFEYGFGTQPCLKHVPALGDRGDVVAYWASYTLKDGTSEFVILSPKEVTDLRGPGARRKGDISDPQHWMERKGLAVDTPIPTPAGWTTMGAIAEGDTVFDMDGQPVAVREVSDVKNIGCYRLTFGNGQTIVCDEEHFWVARIGWKQSREGWDTIPIAQLFEAKQQGKPVTIPVADMLALPEADLEIDPWVLGFWLGDGATGSARVTTCPEDLPDIIEGIQAGGYEVGAVRPDPRSRALAVGILGLKRQLRETGLLGSKHVPSAYLRGSAGQRLGLLQGLMDADGWIDEARGRVYFGSTDELLTDAVAELARSLGEQVSRNKQTKRGFGKKVISHVVMWQPTVCPFVLKRKRDRFRTRSIPAYRAVKSIERIPSVPTRCIGVDSPTRTYLAGVDMIPTHNTALKQALKLAPKSTALAAALATDEVPIAQAIQTPGLENVAKALEPAEAVDAETGEVHQ